MAYLLIAAHAIWEKLEGHYIEMGAINQIIVFFILIILTFSLCLRISHVITQRPGFKELSLQKKKHRGFLLLIFLVPFTIFNIFGGIFYLTDMLKPLYNSYNENLGQARFEKLKLFYQEPTQVPSYVLLDEKKIFVRRLGRMAVISTEYSCMQPDGSISGNVSTSFQNPGVNINRFSGVTVIENINGEQEIFGIGNSLFVLNSGISIRISADNCNDITNEELIEIAKSLAIPNEFPYKSVSSVSNLKIR